MISPATPKRGESGVSLILGTVSLVMIVPLLGLSVDASFLYAAKGRLQAAVDGASLGAARALNLGNTLVSQQTNAAQNAVNWFYANFPPGTWSTSGTVMSNGGVTENDANGYYSTNVNIFPDATNAQLDHVDITASTKVPTWFMKWFGLGPTTITAVSHATRRAAVVMMVLDRSGSMCAVNGVPQTQPCTSASAGSACQAMIGAAKEFTGQFAEGRDYIGMVTFSSNTYVVVPAGKTAGIPDQNFQTTLGYTNNFGTGAGYIDNLQCEGGTGTPQAIALGYQLLVQTGLPGALNILLIETDGLPNTMTMNFYDSVNNKVALANGSNCTDTAGKKMSSLPTPGFGSAAVIPHWNNFSLNLTAAPFGTTNPGLYPNTPLGMIGTVYSTDPPATSFDIMMNQWSNPAAQTPQITSGGAGFGQYNTNEPLATVRGQAVSGCSFNGSLGNYNSDFAWWPMTDVYGNQLKPALNPYKAVTTSSYNGFTRVDQSGWTNYHNGVLNATDNAAYNARANVTYPAYVFALGLGNNSVGAPPDPILMQRMANDPDGDTFNTPAKYSACSMEPGCITYSGQLQGNYVFAPTSAELSAAFLQISSQILRLSK